VNRDELLAFLRQHKHAVEATTSPAGPQAAVVGVAVTDRAELVFDTLRSTRKYANLKRDPRVAFVVGWDDATIQYEGVVDEPEGAELEAVKKTYFETFPDGLERQAWEGITYLRAKPTWIRFSDFSGAEPIVEQLDPATLSTRAGPPAPLDVASFGAVIFDMDGLLLDSEPTWHAAERAMARASGVVWTEEDAAACHGRGIPETARRIAAAAGRPFDPELHPRMLVDAFLAAATAIEPKRGARALVAARGARGVPIAGGSSSPRRVVERLLEATGFASSFPVVVSGDDVARLKPEPDIFLRCAERLGVAPARCAVLEDSLAGVAAAKRAGMFAIAVPELGAYLAAADRVAIDLEAVVDQLAGAPAGVAR
jgi:HAD superfamily hydrolase (TIGR01509 family)